MTYDFAVSDPSDKPVLCQLVDPADLKTPLVDDKGKPIGFMIYGYYSKKGVAERDKAIDAAKQNPPRDNEDRRKNECTLLANVIDKPVGIVWHGEKLDDGMIASRDFFLAREDIKDQVDRFWSDQRNFLAG